MFPRARSTNLALEHAGGSLNAYECVKAFSETDFTEDLKKFDVPTLVLHGGRTTRSLPVKDSSRQICSADQGCQGHLLSRRAARITATHQDQVNADLLASSRPDPRRDAEQPAVPPHPVRAWAAIRGMLITAAPAESAPARPNLCARDVNRLLDFARRYGEQVVPIERDVTDRSHRRAQVATAMERSGCFDVLLNKAGYPHPGPVE